MSQKQLKEQLDVYMTRLRAVECRHNKVKRLITKFESRQKFLYDVHFQRCAFDGTARANGDDDEEGKDKE